MYEYLVLWNPNDHAGYDPPTHPNPNSVRILKTVQNSGRFLNWNWVFMIFDDMNPMRILMIFDDFAWYHLQWLHLASRCHQMSRKIFQFNWSGQVGQHQVNMFVEDHACIIINVGEVREVEMFWILQMTHKPYLEYKPRNNTNPAYQHSYFCKQKMAAPPFGSISHLHCTLWWLDL